MEEGAAADTNMACHMLPATNSPSAEREGAGEGAGAEGTGSEGAGGEGTGVGECASALTQDPSSAAVDESEATERERDTNTHSGSLSAAPADEHADEEENRQVSVDVKQVYTCYILSVFIGALSLYKLSVRLSVCNLNPL